MLTWLQHPLTNEMRYYPAFRYFTPADHQCWLWDCPRTWPSCPWHVVKLASHLGHTWGKLLDSGKGPNRACAEFLCFEFLVVSQSQECSVRRPPYPAILCHGMWQDQQVSNNAMLSLAQRNGSMIVCKMGLIILAIHITKGPLVDTFRMIANEASKWQKVPRPLSAPSGKPAELKSMKVLIMFGLLPFKEGCQLTEGNARIRQEKLRWRLFLGAIFTQDFIILATHAIKDKIHRHRQAESVDVWEANDETADSSNLMVWRCSSRTHQH